MSLTLYNSRALSSPEPLTITDVNCGRHGHLFLQTLMVTAMAATVSDINGRCRDPLHCCNINSDLFDHLLLKTLFANAMVTCHVADISCGRLGFLLLQMLMVNAMVTLVVAHLATCCFRC